MNQRSEIAASLVRQVDRQKTPIDAVSRACDAHPTSTIQKNRLRSTATSCGPHSLLAKPVGLGEQRISRRMLRLRQRKKKRGAEDLVCGGLQASRQFDCCLGVRLQ